MKKNLCILCSFILILTLTACGTGFDGSRTGNDSELVMDFKILNTTDSQALAAAEGDTIHAELAAKDGCLSFTIQKGDEEPFYVSEKLIGSQQFDFEINESGTYTVTVTGKMAKNGSVSFTVVNNQ